MRLKILLGRAALIVVFLAVVNLLMLITSLTAPVNLLLSSLPGLVGGDYLTFVFLVPVKLGRLGPKRELPPPGPMITIGRCGGRIG